MDISASFYGLSRMEEPERSGIRCQSLIRRRHYGHEHDSGGTPAERGPLKNSRRGSSPRPYGKGDDPYLHFHLLVINNFTVIAVNIKMHDFVNC